MGNPDVFSAVALAESAEAFRSMEPPARLAVFGDPIAHSVSPQMQNAALQACGLPCQYIRIHATAEEFPAALRALSTSGFLGANVTIPHKVAAAQNCDFLDDSAKLIGAANTVLVENGKLHGFNTDGPGFVRAIREEFYVDVRDLRVMVFGAGGGAGRAIAAQCASERCERLVLVNRTFEKAKTLAAELEKQMASDRLLGPRDRCFAIPWDEPSIAEEIASCDLLVNASSLGMKRSDPPALPGHLITPNLLVYDAVYAGGNSRLLEAALEAGARGANGLSMLLHQGAIAFEIWFNRDAPLEIMRNALLKAQKK